VDHEIAVSIHSNANEEHQYMNIYHKHHIIPKHMGGTDEKSNIVLVSMEEHANLHKQLWEDLGHWEDEIAWKALSGQITHAEATLVAIKKAQTGRKHTKEHIEKVRQKLIGRKHSEETKQKISKSNKGKHSITDERKKIIGLQHKGKKLSDAHRNILKETHLGVKKSMEQKQKMSEARKLWWKKRKEGYSNAR